LGPTPRPVDASISSQGKDHLVTEQTAYPRGL
jgi:hypothetical protein